MPTILALRKKNLLFQSYAGNPSTSSCEYLACRKLFDVLQCKLVRNYLVQGSPRQLSILTCPGRKTNFLDFFGWSKTFWFQIHGGRFQIWTNSCVNVPSSNSQLVEPENLGFAAPPPASTGNTKLCREGGGQTQRSEVRPLAPAPCVLLLPPLFFNQILDGHLLGKEDWRRVDSWTA